MKGPRLPIVTKLSDVVPDRTYPVIRDAEQRNVFLSSTLAGTHTSLAVSNEVPVDSEEPQRIRSVQVSSVSGGTVTVQVKVDGRDIFDDTLRPVSAGAPKEATDLMVFPAGASITSVIEATTGTPTGSANVDIITEPYVALGRFHPVVLQGSDQLSPSKRREARILNTNGAPPGFEYVSRIHAYALGGSGSLAARMQTDTESRQNAPTNSYTAASPRPRTISDTTVRRAISPTVRPRAGYQRTDPRWRR